MDPQISQQENQATNTPSDPNQNSHETESSVLKNIIFGLVALVVFLLPIFFIPVVPLPVVFAKYGLFAILVSLGLVLWSIDAIKSGSITFNKSPLLLLLGLLALVSLASSIMSSSFNVSFFGLGGEFDTTLAIILFTVFAFLVSTAAKDKKKVVFLLLSLLASSVVLVTYQILRLFLDSGTLSFGLFFVPSITPVGAWYSFAVFTGLASIISLTVLDVLKINQVIRALTTVFLIIFLAFLALVNFSLVWILLGLASLLIFAYESSERLKQQHDSSPTKAKIRKISVPYGSLAVFVISVFFLIAGGTVSSVAGNFFNIDYLESRPSWQSTTEVVEESVNENPILGVGPNRFKQAWEKYRPIEVNQTIFWNADYRAGVGYIPTFASTHGILGILTWLGIIVSVLYLVFRMTVRSKNVLMRFLFLSVSVSLLYLISIAIFYVPSLTLLIFMFLFMGLLLAVSALDETSKAKEFIFVEKVNIAFVSIFALALVLIAGAWMGYIAARQTTANGFFRTGLVEANSQEGFSAGLNHLSRAASIFETDLYYRGLTEISIRQLNTGLSGASRENAQALLQNGLSQIVGFGRAAIAYDEGNVDNWLSLASAYEYMIPFQIEDAAQASRETYEEAGNRDPITPVVDLALARVALLENNPDEAREHLANALEKKPDYTEALLLLSEMSLGEGNTNEALNTMTLAALSSPQNADIYLRMGNLLYEDGRFEEAVSVLERAVLINPFYANAKYFLGLAYFEAGRVNDAVLQFEDIRELNPGNELIEDILSNLNAGEHPLEGI